MNAREPLQSTDVDSVPVSHRRLERSVSSKDPRRATKDEKKTRWLAEHEAELAEQHPGMWAAISDDGLAGLGSTLLQAEEQATAAGQLDVVYLLIRPPRRPGEYFVPSFRVVR